MGAAIVVGVVVVVALGATEAGVVVLEVVGDSTISGSLVDVVVGEETGGDVVVVVVSATVTAGGEGTGSSLFEIVVPGGSPLDPPLLDA